MNLPPGEVFRTSFKITSLVKVGAGTQVLTGNNTYTGTTKVSAGTLQIGNGGESGTLGTGAVTVNGTLRYNKSVESTLTEILGSGKIQNQASTLNLGSATTPFAQSGQLSLQVDAGAVINNFVGDTTQTLSGTYSGAGTLHFVGNSPTLDASHSEFAMEPGGKVQMDGGTLVASANSQFGTLQVTGDVVWKVTEHSDWIRTHITGNKGNLTPMTDPALIESTQPKGYSENMDSVANNTDKTAVRVELANNSAYAYSRSVYVPEAVHIDLTGSFDDYAGVFIKQYADVNGNPVNGDWETVLAYGTACARVNRNDYTLQAGYYLLDARVADVSGDAFANSTVVKDPSGKTLGLGVRKTGTLSGDTYNAWTINAEDGYVGIPEIQLLSPKGVLNANFDIADGKTLEVQNTTNYDSMAMAVNVEAKGTGTLYLSNAVATPMDYTLNGSTEGNLRVGENIVLQLSKDDMFDVQGSFTQAPGARYEVNVDGITEDTSWFGDVTEVVGLDENTVFAITATEAMAPVSLSFFNETELTAEQWNKIIDFSGAEGFLNYVASIGANGQLQLLVGDKASLPEPGTWMLLLLGIAMLSRRKRIG